MTQQFSRAHWSENLMNASESMGCGPHGGDHRSESSGIMRSGLLVGHEQLGKSPFLGIFDLGLLDQDFETGPETHRWSLNKEPYQLMLESRRTRC